MNYVIKKTISTLNEIEIERKGLGRFSFLFFKQKANLDEEGPF